jgi:hypothetical protein
LLYSIAILVQSYGVGVITLPTRTTKLCTMKRLGRPP